MPAHRRRDFRYPAHMAQREATVTVGETTIEAAIVDESAGGLGVIVSDLGELKKGLVVLIQEREEPSGRAAKVMHIAHEEQFDIYRIGLEWS